MSLKVKLMSLFTDFCLFPDKAIQQHKNKLSARQSEMQMTCELH